MLLAQANIALFRWPLTDARMLEFNSQIEAMNHLAESSEGFVWRFSDDYDSTGRESPFDHPLLFFNMSVWRNVESLRHFVFHTEHIEMLRRKSEWTLPVHDFPPIAMWRIEESANMPTVAAAIAQLKKLRSKISGEVFTFANIDGS